MFQSPRDMRDFSAGASSVDVYSHEHPQTDKGHAARDRCVISATYRDICIRNDVNMKEAAEMSRTEQVRSSPGSTVKRTRSRG